MKDKKLRKFSGYSEGNFYSLDRRITGISATLTALIKVLGYKTLVESLDCGCCVKVTLSKTGGFK